MIKVYKGDEQRIRYRVDGIGYHFLYIIRLVKFIYYKAYIIIVKFPLESKESHIILLRLKILRKRKFKSLNFFNYAFGSHKLPTRFSASPQIFSIINVSKFSTSIKASS